MGSTAVLILACISGFRCASSPAGVAVDATAGAGAIAFCGEESASIMVRLSATTDSPIMWAASFEGPYGTNGAMSGTIDGVGSITIPVVARFPAFVPSATVIPGTLIITTNDPEHPIVRIPLSATSYGAELHAEATSFGDIPITASSLALPVLIKNTGNAPVDVELGAPSRSEFIVVTPGVHLESGASASPTMRFSPTTTGMITATVPLVVKGPQCGVRQDVALSGKGTNGVVLTSPGSVDFGLVDCGTTAPPKKVTVANTGDAAFSFTATLSNALFDVAPSAASLPAGQSVEVTITPKPIPSTSAVTPDLYGGTLTITSNALGDLPHVIDLHQTAYGAILQSAVVFADRGSRMVDDPSVIPLGTVTNTGNASVNLNGTAPGGVGITGTIPAFGSGVASTSMTLDPAIRTLGKSFVAAVPLAASPTPLCAPAPVVSVGARPMDRALSLGRAGICAVGHTHRAYCMGGNGNGQIAPGPPLITDWTVVPGIQADVAGAAGWAPCFAKGAVLTCRNLNQNIIVNPPPFVWTTTFNAPIAKLVGSSSWTSLLVILSDGSIHGVGTSTFGMFGAGDPTNLPFPGPFAAMGGATNVVDAAMSLYNACIVRTNGTVACAGNNTNGAVIIGTSSGDIFDPVDIPGINDAIQVAVSYERSCALRVGGDVVCWGGKSNPPPGLSVVFSQAKEITGGSYALCALKSTSGGMCNLSSPNSPTFPPMPAQAFGLTSVEDSPIQGCFLLPGGTVSCWDYNGTIAPRVGFD